MEDRTCAAPDCAEIISGHGNRKWCSSTCYYRVKHRRRWARTHGTVRKDYLGAAPGASSLEKFEVKVRKSAGCWVWLGSTTDSGYGMFRADGHYRAHRWAYAHFVGPIPEGLSIDHLCGNPGCVNPDHLEAVTVAENIRRANAA